jgi:hypothetical protein
LSVAEATTFSIFIMALLFGIEHQFPPLKCLYTLYKALALPPTRVSRIGPSARVWREPEISASPRSRFLELAAATKKTIVSSSITSDRHQKPKGYWNSPICLDKRDRMHVGLSTIRFFQVLDEKSKVGFQSQTSFPHAHRARFHLSCPLSMGR